MAVKDLKIRQGNVDIIVDIVDVGETRQFDKFGKSGRVATAIAKVPKRLNEEIIILITSALLTL